MKWIWPVARVSMRRPVTVIVLMTMVTVVCVTLVRQTKIDTDLANLLPEGNPHVESLFRLTEKMGAEDNFQVIITGGSPQQLIEAGETIVDRMKSASRGGERMVNQVEFRNETDFIRDNFLYFLRPDEMADIIIRIEEEIENAKRQVNPFYVELDNEMASDVDMEALRFQLPSEYVFSADSTAVMITVYPNGSKSDIHFIDDLFAMVDEAIHDTKRLHTDSDLEIFYGGAFSEYITKFNDLRGTLNFAVRFGMIAIVVFLVVYLILLSNRYLYVCRGSGEAGLGSSLIFVLKSLLGILLALGVSLLMTFAAAYVMFGELNIMTTVLIAILLGVNIDYVLHFYSVYLRERSVTSHALAVKRTLFGCGKTLFISCLTTGLAMLALFLSDFRGFYEFGVIFFIGVTSIYVVTCSLFISMLTLLKVAPSQKNAGVLDVVVGPVGDSDNTVKQSNFDFAQYSGIALVIIVVLSAPGLFLSSFEYNFGDLEPKSDIFSEFNMMKDSFDTQRRSDPAYFLFDRIEDASTAAKMIRGQVGGQFQTVGYVESFAERFPNDDGSVDYRLHQIASVRQLLDDPFLESKSDSVLTKLRKAATQNEYISLGQVPDFFKNRFTDRDGNIAGIVVINPNMMLADGRSSMQFKQDAGQITLGDKTYFAASTSIIAASILEIITTESRLLIVMPLVITLLCLVIFFRSVRWGILTFAPLFCALVILAGVMGYIGLKFNLYNLIVLPAILGVGADNGIHLFHRIREEKMSGFGEILRSTGFFITASSVTTALGFIGLIFTDHPGLQSMGIVATGGILLTLITSIIIASGYSYYLRKV